MMPINNYFSDVDSLAELESHEKWEEARCLLQKMWESDRLNSKKLIRLLSECWHVLSLWDCCIKTEELSYNVFQSTLIEYTEFGLRNFENDPYFLSVTGYMISLFPYLFYELGECDRYKEWENKGKEMLLKSKKLNPDDAIANILYLGTTPDFAKYNEAKFSIAPSLVGYFPGETAIEIYFRDILSPV